MAKQAAGNRQQGVDNRNSQDAGIREQIALEEIRKALQGLQFGCVTIVVQDGIVIQIDRTSKSRVDYSERVSGGEGI